MDEFGLDPRAKEAVSFAILAYATVEGIPDNVPSATGARRAVVMGKVVPGRNAWIEHRNLARECSLLDPAFERAMAEESSSEF
jgi:hypothetical protein